jgi:glyoxylase-like metal-dependent hydrolase (beta-lactamase superfamily II)
MHPWFPRWHISAPCLMVETEQGLVLVDTGLGVHDYEHPSRMVRLFLVNFGIPRNPEMSAVRQISNNGYASGAVKHIVLTHLHFDHAGGLPDFPHTQVHVHQREYQAMLKPRRLIELGYNPADFAHHPKWVLYDDAKERWFDFDAIALPFTPPMYLIPLFGHTRGHCGVVIQDGEGWIFQCADALPTNVQFDLTPNWLNRLVIGPHVPRLRQFALEHPEVKMLAGHMYAPFVSIQP